MTNATWAGRSATPPTPEDDDRRAGWIPIAGVVAALGLVGAGGYVLGSSDGPGVAEAAAPTTTVQVDTTDAPAAESIAPLDDEAAPADSDVSAEDGSSEESAAEESPAQGSATEDSATEDSAADETAADETAADETAADDSRDDRDANRVVIEEGQVRGALLSGGVLYLGGAVPSQDVADQIIERAEAVIGEGNVVSEYVVDPDAEVGDGAPLYIDDVVLFAYGANTYDPQFEPLLDLGLLLLSQNPDVIVTIVTHTDTSGSADYNERLSYQRGQSVAQYWVDRGIPVEQIVIDARGESEPVVDDEHGQGDAAQLNRRAEFYIEGLLP